jgi:WD domain, G-beta repeat
MTDGPGDNSSGAKPADDAKPGEEKGKKRHLGDDDDQKSLGAVVVGFGFLATILAIVSPFVHGSLVTALWTLGIALLVVGGVLVWNRTRRTSVRAALVVLLVVLVVLVLVMRGTLSHTSTIKPTTPPHPTQSAESQPTTPTPSSTLTAQCTGGAAPDTRRPKEPFAGLSVPDNFPVYSVAYSPNGKWLAVASDNVNWSVNPPLNKGGSLSLWQVVCPKVAAEHLVTTITDPGSEGVWQTAFSPDGKYLAAADGNHIAYIWDVSGTTPLLFAQLHDPQNTDIASVVFGPHDALFTADLNDGAYEWNISTQLISSSFITAESPYVALDSMAISPDDHTLALGYSSGTIRLWNIADDRAIATLPAQADQPVTSLAFGGQDGDTLAAGSDNGRTYLWDLVADSLAATLSSGAGQQVEIVTFNPAETLLAVATASDGSQSYGHVYLWRTGASPTSLGSMQYSGEPAVFGLAFSPDGETLATSDYGASAYLWHMDWLVNHR